MDLLEMDELILKKIAFLFDIKGNITLRKDYFSYVLWAQISSLNKKTSDSLKQILGFGYSYPIKSGRSYYFSVAADIALEFLELIKPFSKWHQNQILIAQKNQKLKKIREIPHYASLRSFKIGEQLKERLNKYNKKTFELQRKYAAR